MFRSTLIHAHFYYLPFQLMTELIWLILCQSYDSCHYQYLFKSDSWPSLLELGITRWHRPAVEPLGLLMSQPFISGINCWLMQIRSTRPANGLVPFKKMSLLRASGQNTVSREFYWFFRGRPLRNWKLSADKKCVIVWDNLSEVKWVKMSKCTSEDV